MEQISLIKRNGTTLNLFNKEPFRAVTQARQSKSLMGVDTVTLTIVSREPITFDKGDKIQVNGEDYFIRTVVNKELTSDNTFKYNAVFYGVLYDLMKTPYRDTDVNGRSSRNTFDLVYTLKQYIRMVVYNTNVDYPGLWVFDETGCPDVEPKQMQFSCNNCLEALQSICQLFEADFRITQASGVRTIHVGSFGSQITPPDGSTWFEWGRGNGLYSLKEDKVDDKSVKTRIWAEGGTDNLPSDYRGYSERLQLPLLYPDPESTVFTRRNKNAHTLSDGTVIAAYSQDIGIVDDTRRYIEDAAMSAAIGVDAEQRQYDDIVPTRTGTVTSIVGDDVYSFIDTSMNFDLNARSEGSTIYLIDGTSAKITFIDGLLAGQEFELHKYDHSTKKFTVKPYQDSRGLIIPNRDNEAFRIGVGNKYKITDIIMPQEIIDDAEEELWYKAYDDLRKVSQPRVQYGLALNRMRLLESVEEDDDAVLFSPGDYVPVKDTRFGVEKYIRIQKVDRNLLLRQDYTITIADTASINVITQTVVEVQKHDAIITANGLRDFGRAKRGWRTTEELRNMIFDTDGYFDQDNFKANTIDTNMLTVGSKSQQFILVGVVIEPNKGGNGNRFAVSAGQLVHMTIDENNIRTWELAAYSTTYSTDNARYLYAVCSKTTGTGVWRTSINQYKVEPTSGIAGYPGTQYYYFLIGVLGSKIDGWRDFVTTYGFTRINGNTITTGKIVTQDGECYLDLDGNKFRIGSETENSWIDWNVTANNRLTLHNVDVLSDSGDTNAIGVYRGTWNSTVTYYKGDEVSYTSGGATATYRYINATPSSGHYPTESAYWSVVAQGKDGSPGSDGLTQVLHIRYSNDGGSTFTANNGKTPGEYIGMYQDYTQADSTRTSDYTWYKIKGENGLPGTSHTLVDLDNENDSILYTEGGTRVTAWPSTHAFLFVGKNQITGSDLDNATWTITGDGNCTFSTEDYSENGVKKGKTITLASFDVGSDQAAVTVACTYNGAVSVDIFTIKKLVGVDKWELAITPNAVSFDPNANSGNGSYSHSSVKAQVYVTDQKNGRSEKTGIACIRYTCSNGKTGTISSGGTVSKGTSSSNGFIGSSWIRFDLYGTAAQATSQSGTILDSETVSIVSDGSDGTSEEKVFKRTQMNIRPDAPSGTSQNPDYVPSGWTDDPTGVTEEYPFEWYSVRTKEGGRWGSFGTPQIWATFAATVQPNLLRDTSFDSEDAMSAWEVRGQRQYPTRTGYSLVATGIAGALKSGDDDTPPSISATAQAGSAGSPWPEKVPQGYSLWTYFTYYMAKDGGGATVSIQRQYCLSSSATSRTNATDWTSTRQTPTSERPYVWLRDYVLSTSRTVDSGYVDGSYLYLVYCRPSYYGGVNGAGRITDGLDGINALVHTIDMGISNINYKEMIKQLLWSAQDTSQRVIEPDTWYTLSFWCKGYVMNCSDGQETSRDTTKSPLLYTYVYGGSQNGTSYPAINSSEAYIDGERITGVPGDGYHVWTVTNEWVKHTFTFKTASSLSTINKNLLFRMPPSASWFFRNYIYICMPKLERGMRATAYQGNGEDFHGDFYEERFKVNASRTAPPDVTNGIFAYADMVEPTGWSLSQPSVSALQYLWRIIAKKRHDGTLIGQWSNPVRITPYDGTDGSSPAMVFRGAFDETGATVYYGTSARVDVVKYGGVYYVTRIDAGTFTGAQYIPTNTAKWNSFGTQFESIATGVMFAEEAFIDNLGVYALRTIPKDQTGKHVEVSANDNAMTIFDENNDVAVSFSGDELTDGELFGGQSMDISPTSNGSTTTYASNNSSNLQPNTERTFTRSHGSFTCSYDGIVSGSVRIDLSCANNYTVQSGMSLTFGAHAYVYLDNILLGQVSLSDAVVGSQSASTYANFSFSKSVQKGTHTLSAKIVISVPKYASGGVISVSHKDTFSNVKFNGSSRLSRYFANGFAIGSSGTQYVQAIMDSNKRINFKAEAGNVGISLYNSVFKVKIGGTAYLVSVATINGNTVLALTSTTW